MSDVLVIRTVLFPESDSSEDDEEEAEPRPTREDDVEKKRQETHKTG